MKQTSKWFLALALIIMLFPLYGGIARNWRTLDGVSETVDKPQMTLETVMSGEYQENLSTWWQDNIPGRQLLIRIRNQFIYTVFASSPNKSVARGENGNLYEISYLDTFCQQREMMTDEEIERLLQKLLLLQSRLSQSGKELYIFITPAKTLYTEDQIPWYYKIHLSDREEQMDEYQRFIKLAQGSGLNYFDAIDYLIQNEGLLSAPKFYPTGIHWDYCWAGVAAAGLMEYISQTGSYDMCRLTVSEEKSNIIVPPNADLFLSLNLLEYPHIENYAPLLEIERENRDVPTVFCRGGSFMMESLMPLFRQEAFSRESVYFENTQFYTDACQQTFSVTSYEDLDLAQYLAKSDLVILEVNYNSFPTLSFGFLDYLLEHPEVAGG